MKRHALLSPPRTTIFGFGLLGACALSACQVSAQTGSYQQPAQSQRSIDNFYQRGDAMSERVSGFMRRIFGGGQRQTTQRPVYNQPVYSQPPAGGAYQPGQVRQSPPISNYERPSTSPTTGVYGYNTNPAATQKPAQPASRSTASTTRKPLFGSRKTTTPQPAPAPTRSSTYTPPQIKEQPVTQQPAPAPEKKEIASNPPATAPQTKTSSDVSDFLPPGTVMKTSPEQPKSSGTMPPDSSLGSIITNGPESTKKESTPPPLPPASTTTSDGTPVGKKGSKAGRVVSPFAPYNELDVTGLESGSLALDPTTNKVFKVP